MARTLPHVRRHLAVNSRLAGLLAELEQRERLLRLVRNGLPSDLAGHCALAQLVEGELQLHAASSIWADRLRYLQGELIHALAAKGVEVRRVRVRVSPSPPPTIANNPHPAPATPCRETPAASVENETLETNGIAGRERLERNSSDEHSGNTELMRALHRLGESLRSHQHRFSSD